MNFHFIIFMKMNCWSLVIFCFVAKYSMVNGLTNVEDYPSQEEDSAEDTNFKMANGEDVVEGEFPYLVAVNRLFYGEMVHHGAGTLITHSHVLTACHVLIVDSMYGPQIDVEHLALPSEVQVLAGTLDLNNTVGNGVNRIAKQLKVHPLCYRSEIAMEYDYGMILLETPLELVVGRIEPLKFPVYSCVSLVNELVEKSGTCVSIGWDVNEHGESTDVLKKFTVTLREFDWCERTITNITSTQTVVPDQFRSLIQLCVTGIEPNTTICGAGSGGPLMCQDGKVMAGLGSYRPGDFSCASYLSPGVFARADVVQDSITEFVDSTNTHRKLVKYSCQTFGRVVSTNCAFIVTLHTSTAIIVMSALVDFLVKHTI